MNVYEQVKTDTKRKANRRDVEMVLKANKTKETVGQEKLVARSGFRATC